MAASCLMNVGGFASGTLYLPAQVTLFAFNTSLFGYILYTLNWVTRNATREDLQPQPALPPQAFTLIRYKIFLLWWIFPAVEIARRSGHLSYFVGEAINCTVDYAAK